MILEYLAKLPTVHGAHRHQQQTQVRHQLPFLFFAQLFNPGLGGQLANQIGDLHPHQPTYLVQALELANLIAEDEPLLERQQQQHDKLQQQENRLRKQLRDSGRALKHFHSELRLARANRHAEQINRQLRGHARGLSSHMEDLNQSVSRIQARQAEAEDIEAALTELDREQEDETLDSKLKAAGISNGKSSGEQVLARIRSRSSADRSK